jgi:hypothetical protein
MTTASDLPDDVMAQAAQDFFASEWADAREESGFSFPPRTEITEVCPEQDHATLLELIRPYIDRLAEAWGRGGGAMFSLMEISEDEWADALYYVLMGCRGHGVSLDDDYGDNIDIAKDRLGSDLDSSPFHSEFSEFCDLAYEVVETDARKPDPDPDPDALWLPGDRVRVDARMPTGDRLRGTGTVLRSVSPSDLHHGDSGVIVTIHDDDQHVEPWSYAGRTICVGEDECESLSN